MKKIISWVAGSFFRQAGRFLFFIVIGGLIFLLIQHNNIQFKWTDLLGIETIKADTLTNTIWQTYYKNDSLTQQLPTSTSGNYQYNVLPKTNNDIYANYIYMGTDIVKSNYDYIIIPFTLFGSTSYIDTIPDENYHQCIIDSTENAYGQRVYTNFRCYDQTYDNYYKEVKISVSLHERNGDNDSPCVFENGGLKCSVLPNVTYGKLYVSYYVPDELDYKVYFSFGKAIQFFKDIFNTIAENQDTQINQTQQIMDTNTTDDSNSTANFFNETNTTSESALTSIVSAPISLINNLVVGSHDSICATLNNKQICLPSGDIIWNRTSVGVHDHWFHGGTLEAFISFFNLVVGGFILYKCLLSLFNSVHKLLDPANSWVGVMKL